MPFSPPFPDLCVNGSATCEGFPLHRHTSGLRCTALKSSRLLSFPPPGCLCKPPQLGLTCSTSSTGRNQATGLPPENSVRNRQQFISLLLTMHQIQSGVTKGQIWPVAKHGLPRAEPILSEEQCPRGRAGARL